MSQAALVHPSPQQLAAFSLGRLEEAAALPVADHLAGCTTCRQVVENTPSDTFLHWLRAARGSSPASSAGGPPPANAVETKDHPPSQPPAAEGSMSLPAQFGRYRIVRKLGEGGMGAVYLAHDTQLDRQVALKVPHFRPGTKAPVFERFYREARAAAVFDHPNLCPVFDVGCLDGIHFLTMPFIEGKALADFIAPGKPLAPRRVAALVRKLALALQEAHGRGVIHRDLKPANILINQRQEPVIMDFGLARLKAGPEAQLTAAGTLLGTPAYMSPEQVLGEPAAIGPACDIYALGVILYQLLAGRLPFEGPVTAILGRILTEEPPPVSHWRPEVDAALAAICRQAMAKQVAHRHASMADLAAALTDYLRPASPIGMKPGQVAAEQRAAPGLHVVQPQPPRPIGSRVKPPDVPVSPPRPKTTGKWRRPLWLGLAAGAAGFVLLLLGIVLWLPTAKGTIKIELSDPKAQVEVTIDKDIYTLTTLGKPLRFRVGEHDLIVTGENFETFTRKFTVRRGDNPVYTVELVPKKTVAAVKSPEPPQPAKTLPPPKLPVAAGNTPDILKTKDVIALIDKLGGKSRHDFSLASKPIMEVNLLRAKVTDSDLRALAGQTHLQVLILGDTRISNAGVAHLQDLTNLQRLDLGTTDITDAGLMHLKGMNQLTRLELYRTTIGDAGLAHLSGLSELRVLGLEGTRVGDAGLAHLQGLTKLEALNLSGTKVSDAGLEHLNGLTNIREFHVQGTQVTEAGKKRLQETWAARRASGGD